MLEDTVRNVQQPEEQRAEAPARKAQRKRLCQAETSDQPVSGRVVTVAPDAMAAMLTVCVLGVALAVQPVHHLLERLEDPAGQRGRRGAHRTGVPVQRLRAELEAGTRSHHPGSPSVRPYVRQRSAHGWSPPGERTCLVRTARSIAPGEPSTRYLPHLAWVLPVDGSAVLRGRR